VPGGSLRKRIIKLENREGKRGCQKKGEKTDNCYDSQVAFFRIGGTVADQEKIG